MINKGYNIKLKAGIAFVNRERERKRWKEKKKRERGRARDVFSIARERLAGRRSPAASFYLCFPGTLLLHPYRTLIY